MPSKPCRPHFLPATWQPNLSASCMLFPGGGEGQVGGSAWPSAQGQVPAWCLLLGYSPWDRLKMTAALNVSPAPRVSTTWGGGKASEWSSCPSGPRASAPFSAQAQTSAALQDPPLSWVRAHLCDLPPAPPGSLPVPRADLESRLAQFPHLFFLEFPSSPSPHTIVQAPQGLPC